MTDDLISPFVASNISLLFALMSRNATISQRIREACRELRETTCSYERGECLSMQISAFKKRYRSNKSAIAFVLFAVAFFLVAVIFTPTFPAFRFARRLSYGAFFTTVILTLWDFVRATETLNLEIDFSHNCHVQRCGSTDPAKNR